MPRHNGGRWVAPAVVVPAGVVVVRSIHSVASAVFLVLFAADRFSVLK